MKAKRIVATIAVALGVMMSQEAQAFYNSSTGRWLSRDPIEERGGLNLFAFVRNEPIMRTDRLGLELAGQEWLTTASGQVPCVAKYECQYNKNTKNWDFGKFLELDCSAPQASTSKRLERGKPDRSQVMEAVPKSESECTPMAE